MRISVFVLCLLLTLIFSYSNLFAEEASGSAQMAPTGNDIGVSRIAPDSALYFLKTIRENLEMSLAVTPRVKLIRQLEFATRRLREVKSLIPTTHQDLIQPTMERYYSYINSLPQKDLGDEEISTRIKESLTVHLEVLEQIYDQITNKAARMSIRAAINRIVQRVDVTPSGRIRACRFLQQEATSSALMEVEREILLQRVKICISYL